MTGAKLNKIHTEFVFFKASPDESTVGVVYSFPACTMGNGAECPGPQGPLWGRDSLRRKIRQNPTKILHF